jgi:hypothetical protein
VDDHSYRLGSTGVVLNPTDTSVLPFVDIVKVGGLDSAELRTTERDHEGVDGGFLDAEFEKMRTITFEGQIITNHIGTESFLDRLKGDWAPRRTTIPLYFQHPGIAERLIFVKPLGVKYDIDELRRVGSVDAQFMCQAENPSIFDSNLITLPINQGLSVATGFGFPFGFPFGFGAAVDPTTTNAYNSGNRPATAIFTIPGPVTNPRILSTTTGDELRFVIDLAASDYLEIDLYNRTVRLNGTASRRGSLLEPNWFMLEVGDNFLQYRADTAGNPPASVSYRNAWR